ncbi:hypothetical protein D8B22_19830 [Verminephrobacter aporrectodeae subsp. tuberculatae]|nr:hypothetical protein [Verminephrobacter aporrectodeae subsp. tuberculatae]
MYSAELDKQHANCTAVLTDPEDLRVSPQATRACRQALFKELERDLLRRDCALAETVALLVLSKKS